MPQDLVTHGGSAAIALPPAKLTGSPAPSLDDLVLRMRAGDRNASAEFITGYGPLIRRRVRGKLGPTMRRLFDSQEILSTVSRRLDRYVRSGRVRAATETQLWTLVFKRVDAALVDKTRIARRLRSVEGDDSEFARALLNRIERASQRGPDEIDGLVDGALRSLSSVTDRQILSLWLMGNSPRVIADCVSISYDALRQRWQAIRDRLRSLMEEEQL
jgi:hypothetical protein